MREAFRCEAEHLKLSSHEPSNQDCPTRWNSTHAMCADAEKKREVFDIIIVQFHKDLSQCTLSPDEWHTIKEISDFLFIPQHFMEKLSAETLARPKLQ